jgi:hypothetical protein
MEDFCNKMQLMNAVGYQGIFEAAGHKLNDIGGVMLWKLNSAFPSVVWQVYDWFLMPNAGYFFMQNACEPVHMQLNISDLKVLAVNRTYKPLTGLVARAEVFNLESKSIFREEKNISLLATDVKETSSLSTVLAGLKGVNFVILNLKNNSGKVISHNVYWLSKEGDYRSLNEMQKTTLETKVISTIKGKNKTSWSIQITNKTNRIAFFIRPQLMVNGEEVLPSYWSSGYFTLAPSETKIVSVSYPIVKPEKRQVSIKISAWNVSEQDLVIN